MASISLDIAGYFEAAFGYRTPAFNFEPLPERKAYADLGSPYFSKDALGREYYMPIMLDGMELPSAVIRITGAKEIVETPLQGHRGSVKEIINIEDYRITIRGLIISETPEYPEAVVNQLRKIFEKNVPVELRCPITDIFLVTPERKGFDKVVLYGIDFPEITGVMNVRPYELIMKSDEPFDMIID